MRTLIKNIKRLLQVRPAGVSLVAGAAMQELPGISYAYLLLKDDCIEAFGPMAELPAIPYDIIINAADRLVFPAFVDSHSHIIFATTREEEFVMKTKGATYAEIAANGGGIVNSARKLQAMNEEALFEVTLPRIQEIIATGTGALEIKSGYGLTVNDELKMLRVARRIGQETALTVKTTFLGAHAVPQNQTKADYIQAIIQDMLPAVAHEKLADYVDVFCETGFFTPDETITICEAGIKHGLKPRIHANQLGRSGGVQAGIAVNAMSVDHLEHIGMEEINLLKNKLTMPTALPYAAFFLGLPFPPARDMLAAGLPLAIASDFNPGSSPSGNMLMMMALACIKMKLTPEEALNAVTLNTAYALQLSETHGSITQDKIANIVITKPIPSLAYIPYRFGHDCIESVILQGHIVKQFT
jgi:imidazolonepropionase